MVMLFTKDQHAVNLEHDAAWADMYRRYPTSSHQERRRHFRALYPEASADFVYPTVVPFLHYEHEKFHRRYVKIPATYDEDVERLLDNDQFCLSPLLAELTKPGVPVDRTHIPALEVMRGRLDAATRLLSALPAYDSEFIPGAESAKLRSAYEAVQIIASGRATHPADQCLYIEGVQGSQTGLFRVFESDLPLALATTSGMLMEFVDETATLVEQEGKAFIERIISS